MPCCAQAALLAGVRGVLGALLQVPKEDVEVALLPRPAKPPAPTRTLAGEGAPALVLTGSETLSAIVSPPVRAL